MYYYSFPISKVIFVALNATCNPILYMCRMKDYQNWIKNILRPNRISRNMNTDFTSASGRECGQALQHGIASKSQNQDNYDQISV